MIKKWVKILPYWLVMKFVRSMNASWGTFGNKKIRYFQIDEGEFVMFSPETQEIFNKRKREERENKLEKKKHKILSKIGKDWKLDSEIKDHYKNQIESEREEDE